MSNNYALHEYVFTFETEDQLFEAERTGYIDTYDIVRVCKKFNTGGSIDYPCKSRESFNWHLNEYKDMIVEIYPAKHCYDFNDYL